MNEVIEILTKVGAILPNDHFVGTSGLHFNTYVNKDFLYPHTKETSKVCKLFAEKYKDKNIEVVVGPALGGIILSQWTASFLSELTGKEVLGIYTEKTENCGQVFTRGYDGYVKGKKVLVVEDIITTGLSSLKTAEAVKTCGGEVVGVCAMVNKNKDINSISSEYSISALTNLYIDTYEAKDCPLCKNNIPINTKVGHGKKFLEQQK
ncbi:phosphoribosyltransferase [Candidatus Nomurabacteria bacterium]|nr:phosphoribosyltransferase [Candidatus Nomurabacteria bacterium]